MDNFLEIIRGILSRLSDVEKKGIGKTITLPQQASQPTTPATGKVVLWAKSGDDKLHFVTDDGVDHAVTSS